MCTRILLHIIVSFPLTDEAEISTSYACYKQGLLTTLNIRVGQTFHDFMHLYMALVNAHGKKISYVQCAWITKIET